MSQLRVLTIDNPEDKKVLKTPCRPIKLPDRRLKKLIADMFETMYESEGVGLAAPQIGLSIRLTVIGVPPITEKQEDGTEVEVSPAEEYVLINPRIVKMSSEEIIRKEGCLSIPGWTGEVPRASWITVEYQDLNGKQRRYRKIDGAAGWIMQHEIDHLEGILYTERIRDLSTLKEVSEDEEENEEEEQVQADIGNMVAA